MQENSFCTDMHTKPLSVCVCVCVCVCAFKSVRARGARAACPVPLAQKPALSSKKEALKSRSGIRLNCLL